MSEHSEVRDLGGAFSNFFELIPALDPVSIDAVYKIRHDVYCRDLGWESIQESGKEIDEYDAHSIHCLLKRRDTGEPVGCTRLILAKPDDAGQPLPFEKSCENVLDRTIVDSRLLPRDALCEVSRLAVLNTFRQRKGEAEQPVSAGEDDFAQRGGVTRFPFIPVGLYLGAAAIARHLGIEHIFVLTEPRLASHFRRIGFDIRPIGGPIEHRGIRVPSILSASKVVEGLRPMIRPLYEVIAESVTREFLMHPEASRRVL